MANPDGKGGFKKGQSGNPGGLTAEQKAARELLNAKLDGDDMRDAFLRGYREQLEKGNALILVDYANRKLGKPAETVSVEANVSGDNPARPLSTADLLAVVAASKPESP